MAAIEDVVIRHLGPQGDGVAQGARGRVYVEGGVPGDRVLARLRRDAQGLARGEIVKIVDSSPHRATPPCPHYDLCGGCTLQHLERDYYRGWKEALVREALEKQGLRPRRWEDSVYIEGGRRRRATFAVLKTGGRVLMGYYRRRSDRIERIDSCLVADPALMDMRGRLSALLAPVLREGRGVDVFVQLAGGVFDMVITGPVGRTGKPDLPLREAMAELARKSGMGRISWRARDRDAPEVMLETAAPCAQFGDIRVALPPAAFMQPTQEGERALSEAVLALLPEKGRFADLFSGCGTFSGPMLAKGTVDAYESVESAVSALARAAGSRPLKAYRRDLFRNPLRREEANRYDAIVFDPPRAGAKEQMEAIASGRVRRLIGVSCNPATFARDARLLVAGGYNLESVRVVDQFTWSHHVELVALLTRK